MQKQNQNHQHNQKSQRQQRYPLQKQSNQSTSWGKVSEWYDEYLQDEDTYQAKVIAPNLLRILGVDKFMAGDSVLDLGCGQGYFLGRILDTIPRGVVLNLQGVDLSKELLDIASKDLGDNVLFTKADAAKLSHVKDKSVDLVYSVLALQNMSDLSSVMSEVKRVLKSNGRFVCVINHPTFRVPKQSDWHTDDTRHAQGRVVYTYMSEKKFAIDMHPGLSAIGVKKEETFSFHHPLQFYVKMFAKHGFAVTKLEEWISHKTSEDGPKKRMEDESRKEIPLFMCLEVVVL